MNNLVSSYLNANSKFVKSTKEIFKKESLNKIEEALQKYDGQSSFITIEFEFPQTHLGDMKLVNLITDHLKELKIPYEFIIAEHKSFTIKILFEEEIVEKFYVRDKYPLNSLYEFCDKKILSVSMSDEIKYPNAIGMLETYDGIKRPIHFKDTIHKSIKGFYIVSQIKWVHDFDKEPI